MIGKKAESEFEAGQAILWVPRIIVAIGAVWLLVIIANSINSTSLAVPEKYDVEVQSLRFYLSPKCMGLEDELGGEAVPYAVDQIRFSSRVMAECYAGTNAPHMFSLTLYAPPNKRLEEAKTSNWGTGTPSYIKTQPVLFKEGVKFKQGFLRIEGK